MKNEILTACYQFVAAAVNGTYQGILIAVLVAASLGLLRRTNAATRYAVWFGTLLLLALLIPAHFLRSRCDADNRPATIETSVPVLAAQPDLDSMRTEASPLPPVSDGGSDYLAANADDPPFPQNLASDAEYNREQEHLDFATSGWTSRQPSVPPLALALLEAAPNQVRESAAPEVGFFPAIRQKLSWLGERALTPLPSWKITAKRPLLIAAVFPAIWLALAGTKLSFLVWQLFRIRRLKLNAVVPKSELNARFLSLRENPGVRRDVALRVSLEQKSAVVLGFFKPMILLPADASLEISEQVLRHELAHVRRYDDWANLIQQVIKAVFFFHPAILWVSKRISLEREIACDDQVLQSTSRPKTYALLLADLAGRMQTSVLAPGVSTNQSQLKQRIDMILNTNRNASPRLAKARLGLLATAAALLSVAAIYLAPRLAFAQSTATPAAAADALPDVPEPAVAAAASSAEIAVSQGIAPAALPGTAAVAPGPKPKPGSAVSVDVRPAIVPHPSIAIVTAPSPAWTQVPSVISMTAPVAVAPLVASAGSSAEPRQPEPPRPARRPGRDSSLEERLDRLEKMVESLVAQQRGNPGQFEFSPKTPPGQMKFNFDGKQSAQAQAEFGKKQAEFERERADAEKQFGEFKKQWTLTEPKMKELAEQHAKMAADQAKVAEQAARDAQRALRDTQRGRYVRKERGGSHEELEGLHKQRETLQKQMEKLDRQIEKLERDQEQLEEQQSREQDVEVEGEQGNSNDDHHSDPDKVPGQNPQRK